MHLALVHAPIRLLSFSFVYEVSGGTCPRPAFLADKKLVFTKYRHNMECIICMYVDVDIVVCLLICMLKRRCVAIYLFQNENYELSYFWGFGHGARHDQMHDESQSSSKLHS